MEINVKKQRLWYSKTGRVPCSITVNNTALEQVSQYKHLGSWMTKDGKCEMDIKTRIGMAKDVFWKHKKLLKGNINLQTKKRMLNCYVFPVARYACESWTLNDERCINSFEQWRYRRMMKIKWTDEISNEEVLQRIRERELCLYISVKKQKMAFTGHVLRGSSGKDLLDVLEGKLKLNSKLTQGRPRKMWLDDIKSWTGLDSYEKIKNFVNDRKSWRACNITCQPSDTEEDS